MSTKRYKTIQTDLEANIRDKEIQKKRDEQAREQLKRVASQAAELEERLARLAHSVTEVAPKAEPKKPEQINYLIDALDILTRLGENICWCGELGCSNSPLCVRTKELLKATQNYSACNIKDGGCTLGILLGQDDAELIDEVQFKNFRKRDINQSEWFNFCPNCGRSCKPKLEKLGVSL